MEKEILMTNGKIDIPQEFIISETKRTLKIKMPYSSQIQRLCKDDRINTISYFRQRGKDKPYIKEGFIEIDGLLFKVKEVN
jgi:hypothetical protein